MKTILDLVEEYAALNDEKVVCGGTLPPRAERRWAELKSFYDLLISSKAAELREAPARVSVTEVLSRVRSRRRLRVPIETELVFKFGDEFHDALALNVSRRGLFLSSRILPPVRSALTVYLAGPPAEEETLLEAPGRVAWVTQNGFSPSVPPGMGVSLKGGHEDLETYLDTLVVEALAEHLSGVDLHGFAPEPLLAERIEL